jgi:hypothetical protein
MSEWGDDMTDEGLEYLKNDESRMEVALRLFDYARALLEVKYGWERGQFLPGGIEPENIVFEVFKRVAAGKRKLNNRFSYEVQLKGMVRSIISKIYKKTDAKLETINLEEEDPGYAKVEEALGVGGTDSAFESEEYSRRFMALAEDHPKVKKDPDLGLIVLAYAVGAEGAAEASKETGIPVARVYEYNRSLKTILREVLAQMK